MDKIELMKIQVIFGTSWVNLSEKELKFKDKLKADREYWRSVWKGKDNSRSTSSWASRDENYFADRLKICSDLGEALNPENWEELGAEEIGARIRKFQEIYGEL